MKKPFQLTDEQYSRFRDLIRERTGMFFGARRRDALVRSLLAAAEGGGWKDAARYYVALRRASTRDELWDDLIGQISVGESYFFRDTAQFDILHRVILPQLIARHDVDRRLRIWCAGCASGEEPYSVAILLRQLLPDIAGWDIFILGTDINKQSLKRARKGRYRAWSFRQVKQAVRDQYFLRRHNEYELKPELREMVTFAYLNLVEEIYPSILTNTHAMDLILCRNVAIYLPDAVMRDIAVRFYDCLVPEGWLMVGASETGDNLYEPFAARRFPGVTLYQKAGRRKKASMKNSRIETSSPRPEPRPRAPIPAPPSGKDLPRLEMHPKGIDLYREGIRLLEEGKREEALQCFLNCVNRDPGAVLACCEIACIYAGRGRLKEALQWCQRALEHDPELVEARFILALVHLQSGSREQAVSELKKVLYLNPEFVPAHLALVNLYQQMDRSDQAGRHRAQVIRLASRMPPDAPMPGAEGMTAGQLLSRAKAIS